MSKLIFIVQTHRVGSNNNKINKIITKKIVTEPSQTSLDFLYEVLLMLIKVHQMEAPLNKEQKRQRKNKVLVKDGEQMEKGKKVFNAKNNNN